MKTYYEANKEKLLEDGRKRNKEWYASKRGHKLEKSKLWYNENRDKKRKSCREYVAKKRQDPTYRLFDATSSAIRRGLKGTKGGKKWETLVGFTLTELKAYLESKFTDGMDWSNYGQWHVDHIVASSKFNLADPIQFKACWTLSNLQPLWALDNFRKGDR